MKQAFTITRQYPQPLATVWQAWTEAERLQQWWGPQGCKVEVKRLELRPGGFFHYAMHFAGAPVMWGRFNYREIVPQQRIVWLNSFANEHCGIERAPFSPACPLEIENTVVFSEQDGVTTVSLSAIPFGETAPEYQFFDELRPSLQQGYGGTFDQLEAHLRGPAL
ncbi:polyketide cyclase [Massilia sp. Root351]|jgi:uncharacterized protein YndB with AHSA1/START domain|uniref:SRPBCC family protein n=1 Tax=Massilia sp. Root351 TaxID=1736522 RepID=UPI00070B8DCB|nr:SRPBCC domain-containing protein [Massilia sp. Root351]KQV79322.1 polyketide cyclase [Massilia sp. Root351]